MNFSGTTALYLGNTSYSKAYIGDKLVWPIKDTFTLVQDLSGLSVGDKIVLAGYYSMTIQGQTVEARKIVAFTANTNNYFYNADFDGFNGDSGQYILPENACVFTVETISNGQAKIWYNGGGITAKQVTDAIGNQNYVLVNNPNNALVRLVNLNGNLILQCNNLTGYPLIYEGRYNDYAPVFYNGVPSVLYKHCTYFVYKYQEHQ